MDPPMGTTVAVNRREDFGTSRFTSNFINPIAWSISMQYMPLNVVQLGEREHKLGD
jgi:hypothetical protein